jgi:hypothetical protein
LMCAALGKKRKPPGLRKSGRSDTTAKTYMF